MKVPKKKTKATSAAKATAHASSTSIRIPVAKPHTNKKAVLEVLDELDLISAMSSSSEDEEDGSSSEDEDTEEEGDGDTSATQPTPQVMTPPGSAVLKKRKRKSKGTLSYKVQTIYLPTKSIQPLLLHPQRTLPTSCPCYQRPRPEKQCLSAPQRSPLSLYQPMSLGTP
jgi:hypothetical protein